MKRSKGLLAAVIATAFIATGCTAKDEPFEATFTPATYTPAASSPTPAPIVADEAIMKTMTCEPLREDLAASQQFGPPPTRAVQVEVGEGLEPGRVWWVAVMNLPDDPYRGWPPRTVHHLTDAPARQSAGEAKWIEIHPSNPWVNVRWDAQQLVRAQSALTKAEGCLRS